MIPTDANPVPIQAPLLIPALQELRWTIEALAEAGVRCDPDYTQQIAVLVDAMADAVKSAANPMLYLSKKCQGVQS